MTLAYVVQRTPVHQALSTDDILTLYGCVLTYVQDCAYLDLVVARPDDLAAAVHGCHGLVTADL